jgi:hypothetical protein
MSNRKLRQSAILKLVSTNIELGVDIGPIHFYHVYTNLEACKSISSKDHRSDITNLPSSHNFLTFTSVTLKSTGRSNPKPTQYVEE